MSDRTRTPAIASGFAAGLLLTTALLVSSASVASAQATQTKPPPVRHVDVEAGVGVHWGMANDVPIEDDLYAVLGLAAPIIDQLDAEFQAGYMTARDNDDDDNPDERENDSRDSWTFNTGLRWYPLTKVDARARPYLSLGTSISTDIQEGRDVQLGITTGPGVRLRAGDRSGFLVRVPVLLQIEGGTDPMLIPTVNYFFQF
jgi:hypothetical protein